MTTATTYTVLTAEGSVTIDAELAAPGLYVYKQPDHIDPTAPCRWRIGHHSGRYVARFPTAEQARTAAAALAGWVDWTGDSATLGPEISSRSDLPEFLRALYDNDGHTGNCAHYEDDPIECDDDGCYCR